MPESKVKRTKDVPADKVPMVRDPMLSVVPERVRPPWASNFKE